jgi:hypothetical protein
VQAVATHAAKLLNWPDAVAPASASHAPMHAWTLPASALAQLDAKQVAIPMQAASPVHVVHCAQHPAETQAWRVDGSTAAAGQPPPSPPLLLLSAPLLLLSAPLLLLS